jgi:hypothetical protein
MPMQHPLADTRKVGLSIVAKRDEFSVEHGPYRQPREKVELGRHVPAAPAPFTERPSSRDDGAEPVPLDLIRPRAARRETPRTGEHRFRERAV